ncbi:hypothetical protein EY643_09040 [Halioglobus maricola]|uniref:Rap1a immunity protein domain-containing protein n=1 Tax=Halioglobus maricola TaxID=2601894 RepID=A0A5P9NIY4_9GAMM|nr:hypothetical protein [Halioglobus maricola]QFU75791.1 hypothetical protein EY643_09040 [Halioglobus maricola]
MNRLIIAAAWLFASISTQAALTVDGYRDMQAKHGEDNEVLEIQVGMYVDGLLDGLFMISRDLPEEKRGWCIPDDEEITLDLALELFKEELSVRNAEYTEFSELGIQVPFSLVMVDALQRHYPCKS